MTESQNAVALVSAINVGVRENRSVAAFVAGIGEVTGLSAAELAGALVTLTLEDGTKLYCTPGALTAVRSSPQPAG